MFGQSQSRGLEQDGKLCQEIGAKIGKATHSSTARASPSKSLLAMVGPSPATVSCLRVGNLGRPSKEVNSRKIACQRKSVSKIEGRKGTVLTQKRKKNKRRRRKKENYT